MISRFTLAAFCIAGFGLCSCSTPKGPTADPAIAQFASSGRAAYDRGALEQAAHFYGQALQRARANDDGPEIARNGYNLAACRLRMGDPAASRAVLREALLEFGRNRMDAQPALLLDAQAARAAGQTDEAARAGEAAYAASKTDAQRAQVLLFQGELAADAGSGSDAAAKLGACLKFVEAMPPASPEWAARWNLGARVAELDGRNAEAAVSYESAARQWQKLGFFREMAVATGNAGDCYMKDKDGKSAADCFYRAARSLMAQGDAVGALRLVESGFRATDVTPDAGQRELLERLFAEIKSSLGKSQESR